MTLFDSVTAGNLNPKGATYYGFIGEEDLAGTFSLVVKKPRGGVSSATLTLLNAESGKKLKPSDTSVGIALKGDREAMSEKKFRKQLKKSVFDNFCGYFGAEGLRGTYGGLNVQGAVDAIKAKDAEALALAAAFKGHVYTLVCADDAGNECQVTATFLAKGKVKISGKIAGKKVTGSTQMIFGDRCAVPFVYARSGVRIAFVLWFDRDSRALLGVTGLGDEVAVIAVGESFAPSAGDYVFSVDGEDIQRLVPAAIADTPTEVGLEWTGKKFDAGKAAKVKYDRASASVVVDRTRGDNVSALTLKYSKGSLSGSFTVYGLNGTRLQKTKFTVSGVMIDGVGYMSAINKKLGAVAVELKKAE
mgnify:CR=1 FL=1